MVTNRDKMRKGLNQVFFGQEAAAEPAAETEKPEVDVPPVSVKPKTEKKAKPAKPATAKSKVSAPKKKKQSGLAINPAPADENKPQEMQKERKQGYNLPIPENLHARLTFFVANYAKRHESMAKIMLDGLEMNLSRLEEREGIDKETYLQKK